MSKNSIIPFLKDYLINFLTSPFLLDTNERNYLLMKMNLFLMMKAGMHINEIIMLTIAYSVLSHL